MDEYLFISMAKLGADRARAKASGPATLETVPVTRSGEGQQRSDEEQGQSPVGTILGASRLAAFSLAFAGFLAAIGIVGGVAAALERVPAGEVVVTQVPR
jgi:hypothetical protein